MWGVLVNLYIGALIYFTAYLYINSILLYKHRCRQPSIMDKYIEAFVSKSLHLLRQLRTAVKYEQIWLDKPVHD